MKYLAALFGFIAAVLISQPAQAQSTSDDQYIAIYSQIQQADSLLAAGETQQALDNYRRAFQQLQRFQKIFPDWNPRVVTFRLNYLSQKINDLTAKMPAPKTPTANSGNAPANNSQSQAPSSAADVNALQAQIKSLQDENASLQAKLKEALSAQPAAANPDELAMARAQIKSLMQENELLRVSTTNQTAAAPVANDTKQLQTSLTEAKQKLLEQTARADKLAQDNQALQAKLQPLLANADALQALREENAALKKELASKGGKDELEKLRAQVAELQSDVDVSWLERTALENRLQHAQPGNTTNSATEAGSSDFSATYHASPNTNQTETTAEMASTNQTESASEPSATNQMTSAEQTSSTNETEATTAGATVSTPEQTTSTASAPTNGSAEVNSPAKLSGESASLATEAQNYFAAHQYDQAEADYQKILKQDPTNSLALANLAAIEMEENKLADAEGHLQVALAQNPNDAYNLSLEGFLDFRQGKYDDALATLTHAAQLDPKNPQIQNYLGVTLNHKGRSADAEAALRKAVELNPNYAAAHNNLAVIYVNEDPPKSELARWHYQKALENGQPRNPDLEKLLAAKGAPVADGK